MTACNGERAAIVRAGKITGPPGPQDDLNCWVRRAARGDRAGRRRAVLARLDYWIRCRDVSAHGQPAPLRGRPRQGGIREACRGND